jgi:S4 domain-containing protein
MEGNNMRVIESQINEPLVKEARVFQRHQGGVVSKLREIEISEEPIELYKILKFENWVASGGEAKFVISEGQVKVNGKVETRK